MSLKITLFFNGPANDGWTETYYSVSSDPFNFLTNLPSSLWTSAMAFRAGGSDLFAARATLLDTGQRVNYSLPLSGKYPSPLPINGSSGYPAAAQDDALFKVVDGLGQSKKMYFRGLPQANVQRTQGGVSIQDPFIIKNIQTYITNMYNAGFQIRHQQRPPTGGMVWYTAMNFSPATALGFPQFTFIQTPVSPAIIIAPSGHVTFQNVNKNLLPGFPTITTPVFASTAAPPFGIVVPYLFRGTQVIQPNKNCRFCQTNYIYSNMFFGTFMRFTSHKTGRSFGVPRGRARSVVHSN